MPDGGAPPTVLVVDDETEVANAYALRLEDEYDVRTAYGGQEALEAVDEEVDVVLLDRRMPDISGDRVLEEIRTRGLNVRVIIVTAVDPDVDILDMPFNDYLCKPVDGDDLRAAIEQQLRAAAYDERLSEYFTVVAKLEVIGEEHLHDDPEVRDEYRRLKEREEELLEEMNDILTDFDDLVVAFREISRGSGR